MANGGENLGGELLERAEGGVQVLHNGWRVGAAVKLHAVAGVKHGKLTQAGERGGCGIKKRQPLGAEGEFFAQLERGRAMARAEQKKHGGRHEAEALPLTSGSEIRSRPNRASRSQARRWPTKRLLSRKPRAVE